LRQREKERQSEIAETFKSDTKQDETVENSYVNQIKEDANVEV
jgi:hypothetical protein